MVAGGSFCAAEAVAECVNCSRVFHQYVYIISGDACYHAGGSMHLGGRVSFSRTEGGESVFMQRFLSPTPRGLLFIGVSKKISSFPVHTSMIHPVHTNDSGDADSFLLLL